MLQRLIAFIILVSPILGYAQSAAELADKAYSEANYTEAIDLYNKAIVEDGTSSDIYYNLGNAYYRADSLGRAIISYERALKLDPTNEDALTNLRFVNTKILDTPADSSSYTTFLLEKALRALSSNGWAVVSLSIFAAVLLLAAGYMFLDSVPLRKVCFFSGIVLLIVFGVTVFVTITAAGWQISDKDAIITSESSQLATSPSTPVNASQQAFLLHEGTKVVILDSVATPLDPVTPLWYEVKVDNEHRAWIDSRDVEKI